MKLGAFRGVKAMLIMTRKAMGKNPHIKRIGKSILQTIFPNLAFAVPYGYDFYKHYPDVPEYFGQLDTQKKFAYRPLLSVVMPTYNTDHRFLRECIDSIIMQSYDNWELCIADDASS